MDTGVGAIIRIVLGQDDQFDAVLRQLEAVPHGRRGQAGVNDHAVRAFQCRRGSGPVAKLFDDLSMRVESKADRPEQRRIFDDGNDSGRIGQDDTRSSSLTLTPLATF